MACVGTFAVFSGVNLTLGLAGQATCHCFGAVAVSPWAVLGLDAVVLLLLAAARPPLAGFRSPGRVVGELRPAAGYALAAAGVVGLTVGGGWVAYGSPGGGPGPTHRDGRGGSAGAGQPGRQASRGSN